MASFCSVIILGNLTRDPELKFTPSGTAVGEMSLAVNRKWKDSSGKPMEAVTFVECVAWGRTAEIANEYLKKGDQAHVSGYLRTDSWEDKDTGKKRSKLVVVVETLQLLNNGGERRERPAARAESQPPARKQPPKPPRDPDLDADADSDTPF